MILIVTQKFYDLCEAVFKGPANLCTVDRCTYNICTSMLVTFRGWLSELSTFHFRALVRVVRLGMTIQF